MLSSELPKCTQHGLTGASGRRAEAWSVKGIQASGPCPNTRSFRVQAFSLKMQTVAQRPVEACLRSHSMTRWQGSLNLDLTGCVRGVFSMRSLLESLGLKGRELL